MDFTVLLHEDETGGYWAEVEELPGCITQGDTVEEVEANAKDAIEVFLDGLIEDYVDSLRGREPSEAADKKLSLGLKFQRLKAPAKS